ncbi:MAG: hypothetical protein RBS80_25480 [Thermoguttaceae bacterium]|jgi:hypothetical protein|nr:hypothetical protein [Thermoguttaceae bacterium]
MSTQRRIVLFGCLPLLILFIGVVVWVAWTAIPQMRYNQRSRRINQKIADLRAQQPPDVRADLWNECIAWASIAHCNICFSEGHTTYEAMVRYEENLEEKLEGDVDLTTIEWIGERLAETGPHGQQYMEKWRKQWQSMIQHAEQGGTF